MSSTIIVVPCFNEELRLPVESFRRFVAEHPEVCFLMVNDGSLDQTLPLLKWLKTIAPDNFVVLHLPLNLGKAEAVRLGCCAAFDLAPDYVGYWDADLAAPLEAIPQYREVLDRRPEIDLVIGSRLPLLGHTIQRSLIRYYLGRLFAWSAVAVLGLPIYDTQCGHKLFRNTPGLRKVFETQFHARWIFDVELFARWIGRRTTACLQRTRNSIYELPLESWHDVAGSKLKSSDFLRSFFELAQIAWIFALATRSGSAPQASTELTPNTVIQFSCNIDSASDHVRAA